MLVFVGFLLLILLVIGHEAGHFFAAKRSGVEVEEFGIGFPPRAKILGKKNGTLYTLNWLPLGGFVRLKGEHDSDKEKGSFGATKLSNKIKIMLAGVFMNFFIAYLLFLIIALIGMPQLVDNQFSIESDAKVVKSEVLVGYVAPGSPATEAGLTENDVIENISNDDNNYQIENNQTLRDVTRSLAGRQVQVTVIRGGEEKVLNVDLLDRDTVEKSRNSDNPKGYLGVIPSEYIVKKYTYSAPIVAAGVLAQFTKLTFQGLAGIVGGLFHGDVSEATKQVSGVVGVGYIFSNSSFLGPVFMLMIVAVISLSLAVMNLLPIPALDGGRLFVTLFYRMIGRPLTKTAEERIHGSGFAFLMILFVLITILDIQRFIL